MTRDEQHHELVKRYWTDCRRRENVGVNWGDHQGQGSTYERLKSYAQEMKGTLFVSEELLKAIDEIYRYPLRQSAIDTLNRQLRSGISNQQLSELVVARTDDRLCIVSEEAEKREPQIICSLGLFQEAWLMALSTQSTAKISSRVQLPETKPASEYIDGQVYKTCPKENIAHSDWVGICH